MNNTEFEYEVRPVVGYEGLYSVSNVGQVFSHNYNHTKQTKQLKPVKHKEGYLQVILSQGGKRKNHLVHRLVLETFVPNPHNKPECDHIDTNKENNHVSNLRWSTRKENRNNPLSKVKYIGKKRSDEVRKKMSAAQKGKTVSEETRKKMSAAQKGKTVSEETRKKMSESHKSKTIYTFTNKKTNETFVGTRYDFRKKYKLDQANVSCLIHGKINHHKGWILGERVGKK